VNLYARAALAQLSAQKDPRDGAALMRHIRGARYRSAMGYEVRVDARGDAEGNYTILAFGGDPLSPGLYPVGGFGYLASETELPVRLIDTFSDFS